MALVVLDVLPAEAYYANEDLAVEDWWLSCPDMCIWNSEPVVPEELRLEWRRDLLLRCCCYYCLTDYGHDRP